MFDVTALVQLIDLLNKLGKPGDAAGTQSVFAELARNYAAVDTLESEVGTVKTAIGTNGDALNASTLFAHLKNAEAFAQRIGANTDSAGPLTLFSRLVSLSNQLGINTDAAGTTTVFARFAQIVTLLGATGDAASATGSVMARLAQIIAQTDTLETTEAAVKAKTDLIGTASDAAGTTTLFAQLKSIGLSTADLPGNIGDPDLTTASASPGASVIERLNYMQAQLSALAAVRGPNIDFNSGSLTQTISGNSPGPSIALVSDRVRYAYLIQNGSSSIQRLDKTNGSVTVLNSVLPAAAGGYPSGCVIGTKLYLQLGNTKNTFGYLDLTNNTWTARAYPSGIYSNPDMRICAIDSNTIYAVVITGINNEWSMLKYTISSNTWTTLRTQVLTSASLHVGELHYFGGDRVFLSNDSAQPVTFDAQFSISGNQFIAQAFQAPSLANNASYNCGSCLLYAGGPYIYRYTVNSMARFDLRGIDPHVLTGRYSTGVTIPTASSSSARFACFDDGAVVALIDASASNWYYSAPTLTADAAYARR
ncbi:hypothetical protein SAMN02799624_04551 [Paenibacillus sp. UNC496MF]|uniref:hypothetical protein n=1 Tax=Paenibacillus sp. UNC496MF TaxID=1502753 RepID=UPI0008EEE238|nr:hypothetical protein [Paenibacillus sp. UNC496MF]SFJ44534.1 hypothetical protein SAMN02799624_04551 [Paenibacillus sp. UNC496MF]